MAGEKYMNYFHPRHFFYLAPILIKDIKQENVHRVVVLLMAHRKKLLNKKILLTLNTNFVTIFTLN